MSAGDSPTRTPGLLTGEIQEYPATPEASITIHSAGFRVASGSNKQADGSVKEIRVLILNIGTIQVEVPLSLEASQGLSKALAGGLEADASGPE